MLTFLCLPLLLHSKSATSQNNNKNYNNARIINGQIVDPPDKYTGIVAIYQRTSGGDKDIPTQYEQYCAGTLIASNVVLTAAHCRIDRKNMRIVVNEFNLNGELLQEQDEGVFGIRKMISHPGWNKSDIMSNDIMLLRLKGHHPGPYVRLDGLSDLIDGTHNGTGGSILDDTTTVYDDGYANNFLNLTNSTHNATSSVEVNAVGWGRLTPAYDDEYFYTDDADDFTPLLDDGDDRSSSNWGDDDIAAGEDDDDALRDLNSNSIYYDDDSPTYPKLLMETTLDIVDNVECDNRCIGTKFHNKLRNDTSKLCTYRNNTDSCYGDSGGPVFLPYYYYNNNNDDDGGHGNTTSNHMSTNSSSSEVEYIQVGVITGGVGCAYEPYPGINERVSEHYADFIQLHVCETFWPNDSYGICPNAPSASPSVVPSNLPTVSEFPSRLPSYQPSDLPTRSISPSNAPSDFPSVAPSDAPTVLPSHQPSDFPSTVPSMLPSDFPSLSPSDIPSVVPSSLPSDVPSKLPSNIPSTTPSALPSDLPSVVPTSLPSDLPSDQPSTLPTAQPSHEPSALPTSTPSTTPSAHPSTTPSVAPSSAPSKKPSDTPSLAPSFRPTIVIELKDSTVSLVSSPSVPCWGGVPSCVIISVILFGVHYLLFPALLFGY